MMKTFRRVLVAMAIATGALVAVPAPAQAEPWGWQVSATNLDGRIETFYVDSATRRLYHRWQLTAGGAWSGYVPLSPDPGILSSGIAAHMNDDGRLEVFGRAESGALANVWQVTPGGGWSRWGSLGGQLRAQSTVDAAWIPGTRRIKVTVVGIDGLLHTKYQTQNSCCWTANWGW